MRAPGRGPAGVLLGLVTALAAVLLPLLVAAQLGAADAGRVFAVTWVVGLLPCAAGTAVVWWTLRGRAGGGAGPDGAGRVAVERALTVVVPVMVVLLVGAPWILSPFGLHVRDTGVGSLILLTLAAVPYTVVATGARIAAGRGQTVGAVAGPVTAVVVAAVVASVSAPVVGVIGAAFGWLLGWSSVAVFRLRPVLAPLQPVTGSVDGRNRPPRPSLID